MARAVRKLLNHPDEFIRRQPAAQSARSLRSRAETWKDEPDPEARLVVFQYHAPAMELHDAGDQAQAQTIAGLGAAFIETHEALQHMLAILRRNASAAVAHRNRRIIALDVPGDQDLGRSG